VLLKSHASLTWYDTGGGTSSFIQTAAARYASVPLCDITHHPHTVGYVYQPISSFLCRRYYARHAYISCWPNAAFTCLCLIVIITSAEKGVFTWRLSVYLSLSNFKWKLLIWTLRKFYQRISSKELLPVWHRHRTVLRDLTFLAEVFDVRVLLSLLSYSFRVLLTSLHVRRLCDILC